MERTLDGDKCVGSGGIAREKGGLESRDVECGDGSLKCELCLDCGEVRGAGKPRRE